MSIFLSYRRADSAHALWLYPQLIDWFGRDRVFWDRKDIDVGTKFGQVIEQEVRNAKAFFALVSQNWLSAIDENGHRRLDSPDDWIRRETALALHEGLLIIPVLVGGMRAPVAENLPADLLELAELQMLPMSDMRFYDLLRERLERAMPNPSAVSGRERVNSVLRRRAGTLLRGQTARLQVRAVELIQDRRIDRAREELNEGFELLMALLDLLPGDSTLDVQLGYLFVTTGQALKAIDAEEEADSHIDLALSVFERVRRNPAVFRDRPLDLASAIKGIGGVWFERGDPDAAIRYYREAIALVPDYPYAWHDLFLAELQRAQSGNPNLAALRESFEQTLRFAHVLPGLGASQIALLERELTRFDPARAQALLERSRSDGDRAGMAFACESLANSETNASHHREAESHARAALALYEELRDERAVARANWALGAIAIELGESDLASESFDRARAQYEALGEAATAAQVPDTDMIRRSAEDARGRQQEPAELEAQVRSAESELTASTPDDPESWIGATLRKGFALLRLGTVRADALEDAVCCFDRLLVVLGRDEYPEQWAMIMSRRGDAYRSLGERQMGAAEEAILSFNRALEVYTRDRYPLEWAGLMMSRGLALQFPGGELAADPGAAIKAYDAAMEVFTRETHPDDWGRMMLNRGLAHLNARGADPIGEAREARRTFQAVVDDGGDYAHAAAAGLASALERLVR